MLTIGLTGGIASGKSTASSHLASLGALLIDADELAREVVRPGRPALEEITAAFGPGLLHPDGSLDRQALGRIVFPDEAQVRKLNGIIHPYIFREQARRIRDVVEASEKPEDLTIVVDAALMIESGSCRNYDLLIVAYCPERIQLQRIRTRDGLAPNQARLRMLRQMPPLEKIGYADFVIDTWGRKSATRKQIEHLWKYIQLTRATWAGRRSAQA